MPPPVSSAVILTKAVQGNEVSKLISQQIKVVLFFVIIYRLQPFLIQPLAVFW